jgi:GBP family porin
MKKSLIALAVLGAMSGAASAQSSVTLYGIVDIGLQWVKTGVQTGTVGGLPVFSQENGFQINSGYQSGSRLGFRGSEALGGGWNAVFTLEAGYNADTGTSGQGGRLFGRQAWAGLQNAGFGTFALGRIATPSSGTGAFDLFGNVDPFQTGWGLNGLQSTFIPSNSLREDNSIIWASPSWAGFKAAVQYSFNVNLQETAPQGTNTSALNLGANWTWGPLFLAATYDVINYPNATTATPCLGTVNGCSDQKMFQFGGFFDLKFMKIHAAYANQRNISTVSTISGIGNPLGGGTFVSTGVGNYNNQAYMLGVTVPLFGGSLLGSYQYSNAKNVQNLLAQFEPDYSVWGIGYSYPFSRRTNMYVGYGIRSWDGTIRSTSGLSFGGASQALDASQFALGIRHLF